jgi:hypothetical protein
MRCQEGLHQLHISSMGVKRNSSLSHSLRLKAGIVHLSSILLVFHLYHVKTAAKGSFAQKCIYWLRLYWLQAKNYTLLFPPLAMVSLTINVWCIDWRTTITLPLRQTRPTSGHMWRENKAAMNIVHSGSMYNSCNGCLKIMSCECDSIDAGSLSTCLLSL